MIKRWHFGEIAQILYDFMLVDESSVERHAKVSMIDKGANISILFIEIFNFT